MLQFHKSSRSIRFIGAAISIMIAYGGYHSPAWSVETPLNATPPSALRPTEIEKNSALQVSVSFTSKDQPLGELLSDLSKKSGLALSSATNSIAPETRVTAQVQDKPLSQVLLGISRLYGVRWQQTDDKTFTMLPSDRNELEIGVMQVGDPNDFRSRYVSSVFKRAKHKELTQKLRDVVKGIDFSQQHPYFASVIPAELALEIRREKEFQAAMHLLDMQQRAMEASIDDYILTMEVIDDTNSLESQEKDSSPVIIVRTPEAQAIMKLKDAAAPSTPK